MIRSIRRRLTSATLGLALAASLLISQVARGQEILVNGGFEQDATSWLSWPSDAFSRQGTWCVTPYQGAGQGVLQLDGDGVPSGSYDPGFGFDPAAIERFAPTADARGSVVWQWFDGQAGDVVSFAYNLTIAEGPTAVVGAIGGGGYVDAVALPVTGSADCDPAQPWSRASFTLPRTGTFWVGVFALGQYATVNLDEFVIEPPDDSVPLEDALHDPNDPAYDVYFGNDPDDDGLTIAAELELTLTDPDVASSTGSGLLDSDWDADGDGLSNRQEVRMGTDPRSADTNGDGVGDAMEDADGDFLLDAFELTHAGMDPDAADSDGDGTPDGDEDPDADGLVNHEEMLHGTNPYRSDSDGDGASDGDEVRAGRDPLRRDASGGGTAPGDGGEVPAPGDEEPGDEPIGTLPGGSGRRPTGVAGGRSESGIAVAVRHATSAPICQVQDTFAICSVSGFVVNTSACAPGALLAGAFFDLQVHDAQALAAAARQGAAAGRAAAGLEELRSKLEEGDEVTAADVSGVVDDLKEALGDHFPRLGRVLDVLKTNADRITQLEQVLDKLIEIYELILSAQAARDDPGAMLDAFSRYLRLLAELADLVPGAGQVVGAVLGFYADVIDSLKPSISTLEDYVRMRDEFIRMAGESGYTQEEIDAALAEAEGFVEALETAAASEPEEVPLTPLERYLKRIAQPLRDAVERHQREIFNYWKSLARDLNRAHVLELRIERLRASLEALGGRDSTTEASLAEAEGDLEELQQLIDLWRSKMRDHEREIIELQIDLAGQEAYYTTLEATGGDAQQAHDAREAAREAERARLQLIVDEASEQGTCN